MSTRHSALQDAAALREEADKTQDSAQKVLLLTHALEIVTAELKRQLAAGKSE